MLFLYTVIVFRAVVKSSYACSATRQLDQGLLRTLVNTTCTGLVFIKGG